VSRTKFSKKYNNLPSRQRWVAAAFAGPPDENEANDKRKLSPRESAVVRLPASFAQVRFKAICTRNDRENRMRKLIAIAAAAGAVVAITITFTSGAHMPDAERAEIQMPSVLHMMSMAGNLPQTPFVGP
jgi:hypothetical protein